ncbi:hypothetical protein [Shumkonia mesophila]|uniref:hypothetical protein n=1 Tax=Shumkonia mesophila TaxID=2838854 RepID=UPI002934A289|nr:hypothetical protein [Shumkonia mesophila]
MTAATRKIVLGPVERRWLMDLADLGPGQPPPDCSSEALEEHYRERDFMERKGLIRWKRNRWEITGEGRLLIADGRMF